MIIIGDIGNTDTKICIINSNYKIIKRIILPTKKINVSFLVYNLYINNNLILITINLITWIKTKKISNHRF